MSSRPYSADEVVINDLKKHPDFPGYFGSRDGSVWSAKSGKLIRLTPLINKNRGGYRMVAPRRGGRNVTRTVHRFILECFVGYKPKGMQCRHLDGDLSNNHLSNLKWGTAKEDAEDKKRHGTYLTGDRCHQAKVTWEQVGEIRKLHSTGQYSLSQLGRLFGLATAPVRQIVMNETWIVDGYVPKKRDNKQVYEFMRGDNNPNRKKK